MADDASLAGGWPCIGNLAHGGDIVVDGGCFVDLDGIHAGVDTIHEYRRIFVLRNIVRVI